MKVLAVSAHPDDIELNCAGTLALLSGDGHSVSMAIFTGGEIGDLEIPPDQLAEIRRNETQASANLIGANVLWGGVLDECVYPDKDQRNRMIDLLRDADPDLIITHSPTDYHPDHRYVSQLVFDSYFQKGLPHLPGPTRPACRFGQTQVYYMDNIGGIDFAPSEYVDITETIEIKKKMLACHVSQVKSMQELAATDILDMLETQAKFRGFAAGCRYAEGFRRLEAFHRGLTRRILP